MNFSFKIILNMLQVILYMQKLISLIWKYVNSCTYFLRVSLVKLKWTDWILNLWQLQYTCTKFYGIYFSYKINKQYTGASEQVKPEIRDCLKSSRQEKKYVWDSFFLSASLEIILFLRPWQYFIDINYAYWFSKRYRYFVEFCTA